MDDRPSVPEPAIFILYGATGDLAHRLVLPAFYGLAIAGLLPREWRLVGNGRGDLSDQDFQEHVRQSLEEALPRDRTFFSSAHSGSAEAERCHMH